MRRESGGRRPCYDSLLGEGRWFLDGRVHVGWDGADRLFSGVEEKYHLKKMGTIHRFSTVDV